MEALVYGMDEKLNQKYLYTLDKGGNEIESTVFDAFENPSAIKSKYSVKYDSYDEKGNWTKRTTSGLVVANGKEIYKPSSIDDRWISSYP